MKTKSKYLHLLIYSFCFLILWNVAFQSFPESNAVTCGIGLTLTLLSSFFIQKEYGFKMSLAEKAVLLTFPFLYLILLLTKDKAFLINPFFIAFILLIFNLFIFKDLRSFKNNIFFVLLIFYYSLIFYDRWNDTNRKSDPEKSVIIDESENSTLEKRQEIPEKSIDFSSFSFMNLESDTVNIQPDKGYTFIITWNESCGPCKKAIKEFAPTLDTMNNYLDSYFIYENNKFNKDVFISSTKKLKGLNAKNTFADYDLSFYKSLKMGLYPVFIIIDNSIDEIEFMYLGYKRDLIQEKLQGISNKAY